MCRTMKVFKNEKAKKNDKRLKYKIGYLSPMMPGKRSFFSRKGNAKSYPTHSIIQSTLAYLSLYILKIYSEETNYHEQKKTSKMKQMKGIIDISNIISNIISNENIPMSHPRIALDLSLLNSHLV